MKLTIPQQAILDHNPRDAQELLFIGGSQSGKTEIGARWLIEHIITDGHDSRRLSVYGIGVPTFIQGRQYTAALPRFSEYLAQQLDCEASKIWRPRDTMIDLSRVGFPAVVYLFSSEQRTLLQGILDKKFPGRARAVWLDEPGQCQNDRLRQYALGWLGVDRNDIESGPLLITSSLYIGGPWLNELRQTSGVRTIISPTSDNPTCRDELPRLREQLPEWYFRIMFECHWPPKVPEDEFEDE